MFQTHWKKDSIFLCLFKNIVGLTDTSRGADSLVCLVAISNNIISQKLNVVLLPWVYIKKKKETKMCK